MLCTALAGRCRHRKMQKNAAAGDLDQMHVLLQLASGWIMRLGTYPQLECAVGAVKCTCRDHQVCNSRLG